MGAPQCGYCGRVHGKTNLTDAEMRQAREIYTCHALLSKETKAEIARHLEVAPNRVWIYAKALVNRGLLAPHPTARHPSRSHEPVYVPGRRTAQFVASLSATSRPTVTEG